MNSRRFRRPSNRQMKVKVRDASVNTLPDILERQVEGFQYP